MAMTRALLLVLLCGSACRSAESWGKDADHEVAGILDEARKMVGATEPFAVERPADTLRAHLVADKAQGAAPQELDLDLVGCLRVAAENSRDWQDQRETLFFSALSLTLARWNYSLQTGVTSDELS